MNNKNKHDPVLTAKVIAYTALARVITAALRIFGLAKSKPW